MKATEILRLAKSEPVFVPALRHLEVANVPGPALRRGRLSEDDLRLVVALFANHELHTDAIVPHISSSAVLPLMGAHSLTAYDAVYLELALRLKLPLATLDKDIAAAAGNAGVPLVEPA
jgi:predicted nucleic acid-binding protein